MNGSSQPWTVDQIRAHFYNRIIDGSYIFDGCLPLAEAIGALRIDASGTVTIEESVLPALINEKYLHNKLLEMILVRVKEDDIFHEIFCSEYISYDIIYRLIQIDVAAFRFRHANFRQLLLSFNFLFAHPDSKIKKYIVSSRYKRLFDRELMPEIKKRKLGIGELEQILEQNQIHGEQAEIFVRGFERERLASHPFLGKIERISVYDANAGYDIVSFHNLNSKDIDRFIEVKSYSGIPGFFWSRNESDVARVKRDSYFLYLVDRDQMDLPGYVPMMIQDPYPEVIVNDDLWTKRIEKYFIKIKSFAERVL